MVGGSKILKNAHKGSFASVKVYGELNDKFKAIVQALQGCILSPLLFSIFLELIIATALENEDIGMHQAGGV